MKLLTVNRIELTQDRLDLEQKIGEQFKELQRLEDQIRNLADQIECNQNTLMMIQHAPNRYLRMKQQNNRIVDIYTLNYMAKKLKG